MKIRVAETTLMKTFEGTDLFSSVVDYVKQVNNYSSYPVNCVGIGFNWTKLLFALVTLFLNLIRCFLNYTF